jgi:hypothetical protein
LSSCLDATSGAIGDDTSAALLSIACYANEAADLDDGGNDSQRHSAALAWLDAAQAAGAGAEVEPAVGGNEVEPSLGGT